MASLAFGYPFHDRFMRTSAFPSAPHLRIPVRSVSFALLSSFVETSTSRCYLLPLIHSTASIQRQRPDLPWQNNASSSESPAWTILPGRIGATMPHSAPFQVPPRLSEDQAGALTQLRDLVNHDVGPFATKRIVPIEQIHPSKLKPHFRKHYAASSRRSLGDSNGLARHSARSRTRHHLLSPGPDGHRTCSAVLGPYELDGVYLCPARPMKSPNAEGVLDPLSEREQCALTAGVLGNPRRRRSSLGELLRFTKEACHLSAVSPDP